MKFLARNLFTESIFQLPNQLTREFCKSCIDKFETDSRKTCGSTAAGHDVRVKQSTDLMISRSDDWKEQDYTVNEALSNGLEKYNAHMKKVVSGHIPGEFFGGFDTGYQIQRTTPGGFYDWHHDAVDTRSLTFIFYLNDIKHKGYTEFIDGTRVQPKAGKLLIFPATNQYVHRGVAPKNEVKYLMTGWIYTPLSGDPQVMDTSNEYKNMKQRIVDLEACLPENNHHEEHIGGHTPTEGDIANSYGNS